MAISIKTQNASLKLTGAKQIISYFYSIAPFRKSHQIKINDITVQSSQNITNTTGGIK